MRSDIDRLMQVNEVDAILITGAGEHNPAMVYMTGGIEVTNADLIQIAGEPPVLFHSPIERDGALKAGARLISYAEYPFAELIRKAQGNTLLANVYRYQLMFEAVGLRKGRVAVYGQTDLGRGYFILSHLARLFPDIVFDADPARDVLRKARAVKDPGEIERMERMGQTTVRVVAEIADFMRSHRVNSDVLVKTDGSPLTIADVKKKMRLLLAEYDILASGTIFAVGRDAGVPHNTGNPDSILRMGETIIFDAFFQEAGGGYWYDFTRTWCLGHASDPAKQMHEQVAAVHREVAQTIQPGKSFFDYQVLACEMFEEMGHATVQNSPLTYNGYVHGLGHGVGLEIHEHPFANADIPENRLEPGMVITIEPGLYYPERGMGIRIEDTYVVEKDGRARKLADYPWDLVLPF